MRRWELAMVGIRVAMSPTSAAAGNSSNLAAVAAASTPSRKN